MVFYVVRTAETSPGESGPLSPVYEDVTVAEMICREDVSFRDRHSGEVLVLTMVDARTLDICWESKWTTVGPIRQAEQK